MTREEIEELKGLAASMGLYDDKNPCKRAVILGKAIQELDQEPILDKVRVEIEEHAKINQNLNTDRAKTLCWCLTVIDKYKEESEKV